MASAIAVTEPGGRIGRAQAFCMQSMELESQPNQTDDLLNNDTCRYLAWRLAAIG